MGRKNLWPPGMRSVGSWMKPQVEERFLLLLEQGWQDEPWGCGRGSPSQVFGHRGNLGLVYCGNLGWPCFFSGPQFPHPINGVDHPALCASGDGQIQLENIWECSVIYNVVLIITIIPVITLLSFHSV